MNERKKCITCGKYLIAFQGHFLHPESPCAGLKDSIYIEAEVEDEELQKKFEELYGKPEIDDYERIEVLLNEKQVSSLKIMELEKKVNHPLIKFFLKFLHP